MSLCVQGWVPSSLELLNHSNRQHAACWFCLSLKRFVFDCDPILQLCTEIVENRSNAEHNNDLWAQFKNDLQQWYGLEWEFSPLSISCNYMDLALTLTNGAIHSTLFEKPQNLYLYLPPHSSHPKGPLQSLILGNILRIHRLCSSPQEIHKHTRTFFRLT